MAVARPGANPYSVLLRVAHLALPTLVSATSLYASRGCGVTITSIKGNFGFRAKRASSAARSPHSLSPPSLLSWSSRNMFQARMAPLPDNLQRPWRRSLQAQADPAATPDAKPNLHGWHSEYSDAFRSPSSPPQADSTSPWEGARRNSAAAARSLYGRSENWNPSQVGGWGSRFYRSDDLYVSDRVRTVSEPYGAPRASLPQPAEQARRRSERPSSAHLKASQALYENSVRGGGRAREYSQRWHDFVPARAHAVSWPITDPHVPVLRRRRHSTSYDIFDRASNLVRPYIRSRSRARQQVALDGLSPYGQEIRGVLEVAIGSPSWLPATAPDGLFAAVECDGRMVVSDCLYPDHMDQVLCLPHCRASSRLSLHVMQAGPMEESLGSTSVVLPHARRASGDRRARVLNLQGPCDIPVELCWTPDEYDA